MYRSKRYALPLGERALNVVLYCISHSIYFGINLWNIPPHLIDIMGIEPIIAKQLNAMLQLANVKPLSKEGPISFSNIMLN